MSKQNLLKQSEDFSTTWTVSNCSVVTNQTTAPDGNVTADAVIASSTSSTLKRVLQTEPNNPVAIGFPASFSIHVKPGAVSWIQLAFNGLANNAYFNLSGAGSIGTLAGTGTIATIEAVSNGFYRCTITTAARVTSATNCYAALANADAGSTYAAADTVTAQLYLWGAQYVQANWPGEYIATTTVTISPTPPRNKVSPQFQNLLLQSQTLDNASLTKDGVTVSADSIAAPDGTTTADTIVETNAAGANHRTYQAITTTNGQTYTLSCYFKDNTRQYVVLLPQATSEATFDLVNGTVTSTTGVISTRIEALASSWYRCSITYVAATSSFAQIWLANASGAHTTYNGDVTKSIYAWGFQLVQANWPGIYQVTTTATIGSSTPPRNIVVQNQNLLLQSEVFSSATWTKTNSTITADQLTNPIDGATTADLFTDSNDGGAVNHSVTQAVSGQTIGNIYTFSVFAQKTGTGQWIALAPNGAGVIAYFDLTNGVIGTLSGALGIASKIDSYGSNWYRCSVTYTAQFASTSVVIYSAPSNGSLAYTGTATNRFYLWGAQHTQGRYAGAYTQTVATAVNTGAPRNFSQTPINLVLQSEDLSNASWTKGTGITATANTSDVTDPLGTNTASKLVYDGSGGAGGIRLQQASVSTTNNAIGIPTSMGVWLRVSSGTRSMIINGNSTPASSAFTVSTTWQLFIVQLTTNVVANLFFNLLDGVGLNTGFTVYVWGVQVNKGLYLSKYVKTTTAAINGTVGSRGSLSQVQNLALQSEDFSNSFYTKTASSITTDQVANPIDGATTADAFVDTSSNAQHYMQLSSLGVTIGNIYTLSVFAKAAAQSVLFLEGSNGFCYFDLANGITGNPSAPAYGITSYGNGWYRCYVTFLCTSTTTNFIQIASAVNVLTYAGTGTAALYLWGTQCTQGYSNLSAYAQTTTAAVNTGGIRKN